MGVGMVSLGEFVECLFDLLFIGMPIDLEQLVVVDILIELLIEEVVSWEPPEFAPSFGKHVNNTHPNS